jgi:hypothetical protein
MDWLVKAFVNGALTEGSNADFYSPISRSKLKTFTDLIKTSKLKCGSGEILNVHISPELVFLRALVLAGCREDVTIENIRSFPIGQSAFDVCLIVPSSWNRSDRKGTNILYSNIFPTTSKNSRTKKSKFWTYMYIKYLT